ncbi:MAG: MgtC/SapB family protein [Acidobacteriaceae bacterium]
MAVSDVWLLAVAVLAVAALATAAYLHSPQDDPGLTTETALIVTVLLGGLSVHYPGVAAGTAVAVAVLLASRSKIHHFVSRALSEEEMNDALVFAAVILVVLPLVPNRFVGPFKAINPHTIWVIVILMMSISAAGYIAVRLMGPKVGLPLAGLASGFVSSAATIGAMGSRAAQEPALARAAVAGAVLSTVATIVELAVVLAATNRATLMALAVPLLASGIAALLYGLFFAARTFRSKMPLMTTRGRAFSLKTAAIFAATIAVMLFVSAALNVWMGERGVIVAATAGGFADTHSPAVSVASLVSAGSLGVSGAVFPILAALTTNTVTKIVLAIMSGGRPFAIQVVPGLLLVIASAWTAALLA